MLSLEMLDVAIGMIFVYLLISLICTAINEMVESKLKLRAVDLEQGIRELLKDYNGTGLAMRLYQHPLVSGLYRGTYQPSELRPDPDPQKIRYSRGSNLPSYIPAETFALALMDLLKPASATPSGSAKDASASPNSPIENQNATGPSILPVNPQTLLPFRNAILALGDTPVQRALLPLIDAAGGDVSKARANIENWYNNSMDRVAGWYKRRVQKIIFVIGFIIVVCMNADSIAIFNNLANERPLRGAIVDAAERIPPKKTSDTVQVFAAKAGIDSLYQLGMPIGWNWKSQLNPNHDATTNLNAIPEFSSTVGLSSSLWQWFIKLIGWLITAFAISLGAPFWFDMLNKVMVVRSTVKPKQKSPDEPQQD